MYFDRNMKRRKVLNLGLKSGLLILTPSIILSLEQSPLDKFEDPFSSFELDLATKCLKEGKFNSVSSYLTKEQNLDKKEVPDDFLGHFKLKDSDIGSLINRDLKIKYFLDENYNPEPSGNSFKVFLEADLITMPPPNRVGLYMVGFGWDFKCALNNKDIEHKKYDFWVAIENRNLRKILVNTPSGCNHRDSKGCEVFYNCKDDGTFLRLLDLRNDERVLYEERVEGKDLTIKYRPIFEIANSIGMDVLKKNFNTSLK